jgi:hypothetical protein
MPNGQCRTHGGASSSAPRRPGNSMCARSDAKQPGILESMAGFVGMRSMWRHGRRSAEAIERRRAMAAEARLIRQA